MALLDLGVSPAGPVKSHREHLPWLEHRCFDRACAYCLENARVLEVDHVEPVSLRPERAKDPTNVLPACADCNGPTGKWDYHPDKQPRSRCPADTHGFLALDPRRDDYAVLFDLESDGTLYPRSGAGHDRARWNLDVLLRLNRKTLRRWRSKTLDLVEVAEILTKDVRDAGEAAPPDLVRNRDVLVRELADRLLFVELFEVPMTPGLCALAHASREAARGPRPA